MDDNKELLLKSKIKLYEPHMYYTAATAYDNNREITAVYSNDKCVNVRRVSAVLINGSGKNHILCRLKDDREHIVEILDCTGEKVNEQICRGGGVAVLDIPIGGMANIAANM